MNSGVIVLRDYSEDKKSRDTWIYFRVELRVLKA